MRTLAEIFGEDDHFDFLARCHPMNGMDGFKLFYTRVLGMTMKPFHEKWVEPLVNRKFKRVAIAAPAGSGKSQLFGIGLPIWYMWFNYASQQPWEGLIVSTSEPQSKKILDRVKDTIVDNELLKELKGDSNLFAWSAHDIKLKNGAMLSVKPLNENVRSYHVDYIFSDEVSAYDKVPDGRNVFLEYVSSRITRKDGIIAAVSTPDNEEDLLAYLQNLTDGKGHPIYHAITTHAIVNDKGEPDINGESIWPELPGYTRDALMIKRQEIGPRAFALQYMCDIHTPVDDAEAPFSIQLLTRCSDNFLFDSKPDGESVYYAAYDPAFSMEGDYNAILLAKETKGHITLVGGQRFKGEPEHAISVLKGWNNLYKLEKITVDTNAGGSKIFRDMTKFELPVASFTFAAGDRLEAFRETISRLNSGCVTIPTGRIMDAVGNVSAEDSDALAVRQVLLHELTNIRSEKTPTGQATYKSHTSNDDIGMCFIMLVNSIPLTDETLLSATHRERLKPRRDPLNAFNPTTIGVKRFNKRLRWT
ncbi:MAG: hypothetical protein WC307_06905 [Candidatus Nanoarchaeia archaeon]|jgi:hypothetical protein